VFACFVMAVLAWGFGFYGHGFYLAELRRLHGWPASLISSASTAYYLVSALLVAFVSDAIRKLGVRTCVLVGTLAFASSTSALPFIAEPWQLFAAYLVMAFGWANMSLGAINNILGLWFRRKRGLAISLALNGASFGGVVIVPGLVLLATATSFQVAMLTGAAFILLLALPLIFGILSQPVPQLFTEAATPTAAARATWTRAAALGSPAFRGVTAFTALALFSQAGFLVHQIAFLEPIVGRTTTGLAVAITTAMAIVGRLLLGTVVDRLNQRLAAALSLLAQVAALAVMTQSADSQVLLAACAAYGFSVGNLITFPSLIIQREFEAASFGMLIGLSTAVSQFTYAFGPGALGLLRDLTGGYGGPIALCITLNLIAAALVLRGPRGNPGRPAPQPNSQASPAPAGGPEP
jgi:MFS family permease